MKSIVQLESDKCFLCGKAFGSETHHVFGKNPQRSYSDADGLTIRVCRQCHDEIHEGSNSRQLMKALHQLGQEKWEAYYGPVITAEGKDPRTAFMERYGKNYL